jgi:hypothetical protein
VTDPGLQFDHAEHPAPAGGASCAFCRQPITTTYFEINGQVACSRCRGQVMGAWNRGSPGKRFAKALGLGAAAAGLGAAIYFGIEALTGYEFGLVAVVVGLLVGGAVHRGANGRGGWRYQVLAMFLTYSAVVATDSSLILRELTKQFRARAESIRATPDSGTAQIAAAVAATSPQGTLKKEQSTPGGLALVVGLVVVVALAYAAPIMIGVSSPLHLVIAGFALYEAWKLNKGVALRVTGPYHAVASAPVAPQSDAAA